MKLPRLDFTNSRDAKGYRIKGETKLPRSQSDWRRILDPWPATKREGELVEGGPWISGHIVSMGGKQERVSLNQFPEAFKDFVAVKTPSDLVNFIARYGPLTKAKSQDVLPLLVQARIMRECIRKGESESWFHFLNLQACLFKDRKTGALEVSMTPSCLLDALWLQLQDSLSSGAVFRICRYCRNPFPAGGNSGRRLIAEFCSDEHRKRFNSLKRSNPALGEKRK